MIIGRFAMRFTQVQFDRVVAGKCPTAKFTFEFRVYVVFGNKGVRSGPDAERLGQFWLLHFREVLHRHFAHVFYLKTQMGLQMGNEGSG